MSNQTLPFERKRAPLLKESSDGDMQGAGRYQGGLSLNFHPVYSM